MAENMGYRMIKKCEICGMEYNGSARQRRCASCKYIRPEFTKICTVCGAEFQTRNNKKIYCNNCQKIKNAERSAVSSKSATLEAVLTAPLRNTQDSSRLTILQMYKARYSRSAIRKKTGISAFKINKILVDAGLIETKESVLYKQGYSIEEISDLLGVAKNVVCKKVPYEHSIYNSSAPSKNAERIRKFREKKKKRIPGGDTE